MTAYSTVAMAQLGAQVATLRAERDTALAKLATVTTLAHAALAKPTSCATRGLVSARAVLGICEGER